MTTTTLPLTRPAPIVRGRNIVAIASGKGGVGKTWLAITLAHALSQTGRRTLLFDGDLGLANVDIQLGLMPKQDLGGVLAGRLSLQQAIVSYGDGLFDIIAGRSGCGRLAGVAPGRLDALGEDITNLAGCYDNVILDLGAGLETTVRRMARLAGTCLVVTTDEPTALTDAYAFIKVMHAEGCVRDLRVIVNMAASLRDGEKTFTSLFRACAAFLHISPQLLGIVRRDLRVRDAIRHQTALLTRSPNCDAATDITGIARRMIGLPG